MADLLQRMLNEVVATPYDPEITSRLAAICDTYALELNAMDVDDYIRSFVKNQPDMEFKRDVENKYAAQYPDEDAIVLPPIFTIVLSQYIVYRAITEHMGKLDQSTASLILMNYMLYRKGSLTRLILPDYIKEMYGKIDEYIIKKNNIAEGDEYNHLGGLLENETYLTTHSQDADLASEIRRMALTTYRFHQQELVEEHKRHDEKLVYVKVYNFMYELMDKMPWKYTKNDVVMLMRNVVSEENLKKTATIESIVTEMKNAGIELPYDKREESSLLLRYVSGEDKVSDEIKNRRLTVMEFGIYIYYELLLEYIIGEYYGS